MRLTIRTHRALTIAPAVGALTLAAWAAPVMAQNGSPSIVAQLRQCQTIAENTARLACFDQGMAAFSAAQSSGELAVIDRAQVRETRRQLFGFEAPDLSRIFSSGEAGVEEVIDSVETTLVRAERGNDGRWQFQLADGSRWHQTSNDRYQVVNREGEAVRIRRASLGSYLMSVGRSRGIRVQRQ